MMSRVHIPVVPRAHAQLSRQRRAYTTLPRVESAASEHEKKLGPKARVCVVSTNHVVLLDHFFQHRLEIKTTLLPGPIFFQFRISVDPTLLSRLV